MKKRICAALLALVSGVLLCGCSAMPAITLPSASQSGSTSDTMPDDGVLRLCRGHYVFCGGTLIAEAVDNGSAYLLTDSATGEADYYVLGVPENGSFTETVYDKNGNAVYETDSGNIRIGSMVNGWVLFTGGGDDEWSVSKDSESYAYNLSTGKKVPLPCATISLSYVNENCICAEQSYYDEDANWFSNVILYDNNWNVTETFENYWAYCPAKGWLDLTVQNADSADEDEFLYNPAIGVRYDNFVQLNLDGTAVVKTIDAAAGIETGYRAINLQDGSTVAESGAVPYFVTADFMVYERTVNSGAAVCYATAQEAAVDGTLSYSCVYTDGTEVNAEYAGCYTDASLSAIRTAETLTLYRDGKRVFETEYSVPDAVTGELHIDMEILGASEQIAVAYYDYDENYDMLHRCLRVYGANGLVFEVENAYWITECGNNRSYLCVCRCTASGSFIYDLLDTGGNEIISGLAGVPDFAENGTFFARRGFEEGWMDRNGNWLWSRSIWNSLSEDEAEYY